MASETRALIVDLGDVLMSWRPPKDAKVSPKVLKRAISTAPWFEFECGRLSAQKCYDQLGQLMSISPVNIFDAIEQAKLSLHPDGHMFSMLKAIKAASGGRLKLYLMSNIALPHWVFARSLDCDWDIFDHIFTSAEVGMRKPDLQFYQHVLTKVGLAASPSSALFIDDKLQNVCSARAVGMQGIVFDNADNVLRQIHNLVGDPVQRGEGYLSANAKAMWSIAYTTSHEKVVLKENFAQLLMLEATRDRDLVSLNEYSQTWNFFQERPVLSTTTFPDDYDTTSFALTVSPPCQPKSDVGAIMDDIAKNLTVDHLPLVYNDSSRPRFDPVACVHIYTLFHLNDRSHQLEATWNVICSFLYHRAYSQGTYYYTLPDYFLYSLARLVTYSRHRNVPIQYKLARSEIRNRYHTFTDLLRARCHERINTSPSDALSLALRIVACQMLDIPSSELKADATRLEALQELDGGWPWCAIYRAPGTNAEIGNRGVVTAFAVKALSMMEPKTTFSTPDVSVNTLVPFFTYMSRSWSMLECSTGFQKVAMLGSTMLRYLQSFDDFLRNGSSWPSLATVIGRRGEGSIHCQV